MALAKVTLDDKYALETGRIYLTGTQALVRLPLMQRRRDQKAGLNTGCFISGYRGSPLGGLDQALWRAKKFLKSHNIYFQAGINEDLAATAIWGSQQTQLFGDQKYDGAFAMWYSKGPGIDRSGDALRHGHLAGSSKHGGVLLLAGDDHGSKSSTTANQSELTFVDLAIPVLNPSNVQEFLDFGIHGWAMSRYSGCWIAFKTIAETVDCSASVYVDPYRVVITTPTDMILPPEGLNIRQPDSPLVTANALYQEELLHRYKLPAVMAYVRANKLDQIIWKPQSKRLGIITCGKSYLDVRQALSDLGIDEIRARDLGIGLYKVTMTWPLEPQGVLEFSRGFQEILVVEEKRSLLESQLKEYLYHIAADQRPKVLGKTDENHRWLLPPTNELNADLIAEVIASRLGESFHSKEIKSRLTLLTQKKNSLARYEPAMKRLPYFCSGCPHNTSTKVPEGSRAYGGIGCHIMATWMDRNNDTFTQMGGEGVTWIGQAPFCKTDHVFQNLGDGTYFHSGILAIRATLAANVNITFKILYNDAVAMTGGQPVDGQLDVLSMVRQLQAEGVKRIAIVSDDPEKYPTAVFDGRLVTVHHRDDLDKTQKEFQQISGTTVIIYDQTCAAEKRRRRKRGLMDDPPKRLFINEAVCEGCGDCGVQSNCLSIVPVETEFGRKRAIDQSSCNKDYSCVKGFCPSFVTVQGGQLKKPKLVSLNTGSDQLPKPLSPSLNQPYNILVTGVGGTGVVTIGALLGMAAHLEGKGCSVLDMTGLSQKGGAVFSHIRIAQKPEDIFSARIAIASTHLLLGCDMVVAASRDSLTRLNPLFSKAVINTHATMTGVFTQQPDLVFPADQMVKTLEDAIGSDSIDRFDAGDMALRLVGDSIATNLLMVGYALQKGLVPLSPEAIEKAIELNEVGIEENRKAFRLGRQAALDLPKFLQATQPPQDEKKIEHLHPTQALDYLIDRRVKFLTSYQNKAYAQHYRRFVERVRQVETVKIPGSLSLTKAVATYYYKLMAYKDEYEVARLYTNGDFQQTISSQFDGSYKIEFNLAPPLFAKRDPETGHLKKASFGPWMMWAFRLLSKFKFMRGTPLDIFGYSKERRTERDLIRAYKDQVSQVLDFLNKDNLALAVEFAQIPEYIRGYGHVKEKHLATALKKQADLWQKLQHSQALLKRAA